MKLTTEQQTIAILDLMMEMAAKNMAFHETFVSIVCPDEKQIDLFLSEMKKRSDSNLSLIRAKVFQYAEVDPNDLLNGLFEI